MKKIAFLTGTRADFGKLKSLIKICQNSNNFEIGIFVTGMHNIKKYGYTYNEIIESGFSNIHKFKNHTAGLGMDIVLSQTIMGFSKYVKSFKPDLIVVHGDRVEPLAGSIVGSLNNILVSHIEGGEVSGTIDEFIRHAVSKMSHIHFVSNNDAKARLIQMGECSKNIHIIGSPDVDIMKSDKLPTLELTKKHYEIDFKNYAVVMFHPVTTEYEKIREISKNLVDAILDTSSNFIVIYPNNDLGSEFILKEYKRLNGKANIKIFPSIRFEFFLTLLKNAEFILGNSSAGIREAPYYGLPTVNIGSRQYGRSSNIEIIDCNYSFNSIKKAIKKTKKHKLKKQNLFGDGSSDLIFLEKIKKDSFWHIKKQKTFNDI